MDLFSGNEWDNFMENFPDAHILQTSSWGNLKSEYGWSVFRICDGESGAELLLRNLPLGFTIGYIPKGPLGPNWQSVLKYAIDICQQKKAIVLYVEPDLWLEDSEPNVYKLKGFTESTLSIQPKRTIVINLTGTENDWLQRMKQKTRYNIRLATKKDVTVERSNDIGTFNQLMSVTSQRDEFGVHESSYYRDVFNLFSEKKQCELLIANYSNIPLAALIMLFQGRHAWYFYGASNNQERNRMPTYLLQWEAMRSAAARGCLTYDLWGVPDFEEDYLEEKFMQREDGLWGVYRFKRGFGGELKRSAGVFEKPINQPVFNAYKHLLKFRKRNLA